MTASAGGGAAAQAVEIVDHSALRVCADPSAPPFSAQDGSGFENKIAALFARDLGLPVRYTWFPNTFGFYRRTLNVRRCDIVIGAPSEMDLAQPTKPYYRSRFAIVSRSDAHLSFHALSDPGLRGKRIGAQSQTPVGDLLNRYGVADHLRAYDLLVDSRVSSVGREMVEDLLARRIDVAVIWGPVATYQASLHPGEIVVVPLAEEEGGVSLAFSISMAVRNGEPQWKARVDRFIDEHAPEIHAILSEAQVPLLPLAGAAP